MKIKHLLEGSEPKLPGAPSGIKVMTPQQFVAKNEPEQEISEGVDDNYLYYSRETADEAKKILDSGFILGNTTSKQPASDAQTDLPVVSFSRNLAYAVSGADVGRDYQVVFVVDRNALESRYKTLGTSQSHDTRGLKHGGDTEWLKKQKTYTTYLDINKNGKIDQSELDNPDPKWKMAAKNIKNYLGKSKFGKEFEEIVPTKSGKIPLQNILVGFYLVPGKAASKDPELINHPLRLDMPKPNTFVKANKETVSEDLRKWFKEKWVRFGPDGKIRGACARGDDSEGKPKCLPQSKAHSLGKKGRASAASRKRREDPNPERSGKAINVATKKKTNEGVVEGDVLQFTKKKISPIGSISKQLFGVDATVADNQPKYRHGIIVKRVPKGYAVFVNGEQVFVHDDPSRAHEEAEEIQMNMDDEGVAEEQIDELKCWPGYTRVRGVPAGAPGSCKKKTSEDQAPMFTPESKCPFCEGPLFEASLMNEKKDACYYKVKSRYKVWPSAYASGALVKCRKKGAKNWGTGGKKNESVDEATKLPATARPFGDEELTSYLDRIRNKEKKKTDKYKYPYIHRSSVVGYYNEAGKKYNTDAIKSALTERPKSLLKKNEKMKHSDGAEEQFFNIGFAALVGVAVDQETNELIIVNTCPGAGSCKVDCFAMKGGKIQFQGPWLSDGRILTYLLNDPEGFFSQLKSEITKEMVKGKKGGYKVSIRWHDAGDFFSPEYMDMAFKLAEELPEVDFYAYTKVAKAAMAEKPKNFIINWSEGAAQSQEREIKAQDPDLEKTKNSRIVPTNLFYDLLVKDEKKNLVKGPEGQWQVIPDKLPELKDRLAKEYGLSKNSILSYSEWEDKGRKNPLMKWNVIITPGEPDLTAKDPGVLSTLLLKH